SDERSYRPAPEAAERAGKSNEASAHYEPGEQAGGDHLRRMPPAIPRLEPEDGEPDQQDVDRRRLAEGAGGHEERAGPEPAAAEHQKGGRAKRKHHEDLGVGGEQAGISRRGQNAVEQRGENTCARTGQV